MMLGQRRTLGSLHQPDDFGLLCCFDPPVWPAAFFGWRAFFAGWALLAVVRRHEA
jgi:hypothetical protein